MAKFRSLQTSFWRDPFIEGCTPEQKLFYVYLITNPATRQCGVYEITPRIMAFETGYHIETIEKLISFFADKGKIRYSRETSEMFLLNFIKNDPNRSPKVKICITNELKTVKHTEWIPYLYGINTHVQEEEEKEKEKYQEENEEALFLSADSLKDYFKNQQIYIEYIGQATGLNIDEIHQQIDDWITRQHAIGKHHRPVSELKEHFLNVIRKQTPATPYANA